MCFTASPFLVLKVVGGVVGVVLGCARCARRVRVCDISLISASGRCIYCCSIIQEGTSRQEQKTKNKIKKFVDTAENEPKEVYFTLKTKMSDGRDLNQKASATECYK